jgi:hypothetical protein
MMESCKAGNQFIESLGSHALQRGKLLRRDAKELPGPRVKTRRRNAYL